MIFKVLRNLAHSLPMCEPAAPHTLFLLPHPPFSRSPGSRELCGQRRVHQPVPTQGGSLLPERAPPPSAASILHGQRTAQAVGSLRVPPTVLKNQGLCMNSSRRCCSRRSKTSTSSNQAGSSTGRGNGHRLPPLTKMISVTDTHWQREKSFFSNGVSLCELTHFGAGNAPRSYWANANMLKHVPGMRMVSFLFRLA